MTALTQVALAVKHAFPDLQKCLEESMFFFQKDGYKVAIEERVVNDWPHIIVRLHSEEASLPPSAAHLFRYHLVEIIEKFIINSLTDAYLEDILAHHYFYFPRHEREEIVRFAGIIREREKEGSKEKEVNSEIHNQLSLYFRNYDYLNIHGLIIFRLGGWLEHLRKCVDQAVDEFLMEKEYQEFIRLLKYFVQLQEPKIYQVHVTLDGQGNLLMLDQNHNLVDGCQHGEDWESLTRDQEDMLVSTLITVAPQRIVLHRQIYLQYPKATDTLKHVFEQRVSLCKRCKLCHDASSYLNLKGKS